MRTTACSLTARWKRCCVLARSICFCAVVPLLGFSKKVYYDRAERFAGESKYPLKKMLGFAMEGITSFSVKPIRMITVLGVLFALLGAIFGIYALVSLCTGHAVAGWTSLIMSIWLSAA